MIEPLIHFTVPANPSDEQRSVIQRARELHPDWQVKVWQDPVAPDGLALAHLWSRANSGAQLADLIRLDVVRREGGFYLDADVAMQRSLEPLRGHGFVVASEDGASLTNAVFGCERGHPAIDALVERVRGDRAIDWSLPPHQTTGPALFTAVLRWRDDVTVLPRATFYPYNWNQRRREAEHWSYGVHLWDHSWGHTVRRTGRERLRLLGTRLSQGMARRLRAGARSVVTRMAAAASTPYPAAGVLCANTVHGFRILLDGADLSVTPSIAHTGSYEPLEERFASRLVRGGDWAIDAGANVGMFTLLLAQRVGRFGRVFAFEPNPAVADLLASSTAMNWLHDRVVLRRAALGDAPATARLRFAPDCLGGASLSRDRRGSAAAALESMLKHVTEIDVPVVRLDDEFPVNLPIRFVKVDVEGFEPALLAGARRLFAEGCVDVLMLEAVPEIYGESWPSFVAAFERLLRDGYRPHRLGADARLRPVTENQALDGADGRNVFLVSRHARDVPMQSES